MFKNLIAKVSPHLGSIRGNCTITRLIASVCSNSLIAYPKHSTTVWFEQPSITISLLRTWWWYFQRNCTWKVLQRLTFASAFGVSGVDGEVTWVGRDFGQNLVAECVRLTRRLWRVKMFAFRPTTAQVIQPSPSQSHLDCEICFNSGFRINRLILMICNWNTTIFSQPSDEIIVWSFP